MNKQFHDIARSMFFGKNDFEFEGLYGLHRYATECPTRLPYFCELTLNFESPLSSFSSGWSEILQQFTKLETLHLLLHCGSDKVKYTRSKTLSSARGMRDFLRLRGIKWLEIVGEDQIRDESGGLMSIDVNDPRAVGPLLRRTIMQPHPVRNNS